MEYVVLFEVMFLRSPIQSKLHLMSFCNVRELLNVGFEIRTQNSTPMAIIPSEDINRNSHLYQGQNEIIDRFVI